MTLALRCAAGEVAALPRRRAQGDRRLRAGHRRGRCAARARPLRDAARDAAARRSAARVAQVALRARCRSSPHAAAAHRPGRRASRQRPSCSEPPSAGAGAARRAARPDADRVGDLQSRVADDAPSRAPRSSRSRSVVRLGRAAPRGRERSPLAAQRAADAPRALPPEAAEPRARRERTEHRRGRPAAKPASPVRARGARRGSPPLWHARTPPWAGVGAYSRVASSSLAPRHRDQLHGLAATLAVEDARRDAVVAAGRELGLQLAALDPLHDRLAADADASRDLCGRVVLLLELQVRLGLAAR